MLALSSQSHHPQIHKLQWPPAPPLNSSSLLCFPGPSALVLPAPPHWFSPLTLHPVFCFSLPRPHVHHSCIPVFTACPPAPHIMLEHLLQTGFPRNFYTSICMLLHTGSGDDWVGSCFPLYLGIRPPVDTEKPNKQQQTSVNI